MFGSKRALGDNGLRNYLRRTPKDSVLWLPGLNPGGATVWDYSGSGNNGAITGATWVKRPSGVWGWEFDGDDYVDCGNAASLQITNNLSAGGWFKTPSAFTTGGVAWATSETIISKYLTTGNQRSWILTAINPGTSDPIDNLGIAFGDPLDGTIEYQGYYATNLTVSTLYHYFITFASGTLVLYINGAAVTLTVTLGAVPATLLNSTAKVMLGAINDGAAGFGKNQMYLTKVMGTTVLTAAQVLASYQQERRWIGV